jgi:hypothetical protein
VCVCVCVRLEALKKGGEVGWTRQDVAIGWRWGTLIRVPDTRVSSDVRKRSHAPSLIDCVRRVRTSRVCEVEVEKRVERKEDSIHFPLLLLGEAGRVSGGAV